MEPMKKETIKALMCLSDEIKKAMSFSSFTESEWRIARLHAFDFYASPSTLLDAIRFIDYISEKLEIDTTGISDDLFAKFASLIEAKIRARTALYEVSDSVIANCEHTFAAWIKNAETEGRQ